jgi:hypothetical protein
MTAFVEIARRLVDAGMEIEQAAELIARAAVESVSSGRSKHAEAQARYAAKQRSETISTDQNDQPDHSPSPPSPPSMVSPITPSLTTPSSTPSSDIRTMFGEFWAKYPKRDGANPKSPALKKFTTIVKAGTDAAAIIAGAAAYARAENERIGTPFIAQAVVFLNQRRWEDYAAAVPAPASAGPPQPPRPGLPTDAELRAQYAAERQSTEVSGVAPEGASVRPAGRLVRDSTWERGARRLESVFPNPRLEPLGPADDGPTEAGNDHHAGTVGGVV